MSESVLIVEDDPMQQKMLHRLLQKKLRLQAYTASNGREALDILGADHKKSIKIVILDIDMPVMNGMEALGIIRQRFPDLTVIMLTGNDHVDDIVKAMKLGAIDFLTKPYDKERIVVTVKNALKINALSKEVKRLTKEKSGTLGFENLIGYEKGLSNVVTVGRKAAGSDIPVLITGETGVGKEVFSQAIHGHSHRAGKPFVAINCGAIPSQLIESTLFGHEKGAFTGATDKAIGKFREAEGGTIFLDEVGELPLDAQVKLLRVLQQREVEPVGGGKAVPVNVRIISATNRDLKEEVAIRRFREDLYFRLNVLEVKLPALRDRRQDIPVLARHFIERFCASELAEFCELTKEAEQYLIHHDWPGNVRELENAINRAMVLSDSNVLNVDDFSKKIQSEEEGSGYHELSNEVEYSVLNHNDELKSIDVIEQEVMKLALQKFNQNIPQAAQAIGMAKSTFYRKMNSIK